MFFNACGSENFHGYILLFYKAIPGGIPAICRQAKSTISDVLTAPPHGECHDFCITLPVEWSNNYQ